MKKQNLQNWPEPERPRERMYSFGTTALSDSELLAILLNTGNKLENAVDLARTLMKDLGSLRRVLATDFKSLSEYNGIGKAKYARLHVVGEIITRVLKAELHFQDGIGANRSTKSYLRHLYGGLSSEIFAIAFLNARRQIIDVEEIFQGSIDQITVYPREIARIALEKAARELIIVHNHPSGKADPSRDDISMTHRLAQILSPLSIDVVDHLIISKNECYSFLENGLLSQSSI